MAQQQALFQKSCPPPRIRSYDRVGLWFIEFAVFIGLSQFESSRTAGASNLDSAQSNLALIVDARGVH